MSFTGAQVRTCTFDLAYAGALNPPASQVIYEGQFVKKPQDPYRAGWTFTGWFAAGSDVPWNFGVDHIASTDVTLSARWQEGADPRPVSVDVSLTNSITVDAQGITAVEALLHFVSQTLDAPVYLASIACTLAQDIANPVFGKAAKGISLTARSSTGDEVATGSLAGCILSFGPATLPLFWMASLGDSSAARR